MEQQTPEGRFNNAYRAMRVYCQKHPGTSSSTTPPDCEAYRNIARMGEPRDLDYLWTVVIKEILGNAGKTFSPKVNNPGYQKGTCASTLKWPELYLRNPGGKHAS